MAFNIDLTGDQALMAKLKSLEKGITGWMKNRAFKPAVEMFREPTISNINHRKFRLGAKKNMKVKPFRRSRVMMGMVLQSQFGTTNPANDPYYGGFVHWGHKIAGSSPVKRTKPVLHMKRAFDDHKDKAGKEAAENLAREIEKEWQKQGSPT